MKVRATKPGFFGRYINEGEVFDVPDGSKASWFESIDKSGEGQKRTQGGKKQDGQDDKSGEGQS